MERLILLLTSILTYSATISAQAWTLKNIGDGAKPDIEVTNDGLVHLAYLFESGDAGSLTYATYNSSTDALDETIVLNSFLFGPADLEIASDGTPHISYVQLDGTNINAEVSNRTSSGWVPRIADSPNNDGWDVSMELVGDQPRLAFVDNSADGKQIELATFSGSAVTLESVAQNTDIDIDFGTSIAADAMGNLYIAYYDQTDSLLKMAQKADGVWASQSVAKDGQTPNMEVGPNGEIHIAYYARTEDAQGDYTNNGHIMLATLASGTWSLDTVSMVDQLSVGRQNEGQEPLDLELDASGAPHIIYANESFVTYATRSGGAWTLLTVADLSNSMDEFGQQAGLALDADGDPHIAYFVRETNGDQTVYYAQMAPPPPMMVSISCPSDTTLACGSTGDISQAGMAVSDTGVVVTFVDSMVQDCPMDRVIMRTWTASGVDDTMTCVQMITIENGDISQNALIQDSLTFTDMCPADVMGSLRDTLTLACGSTLDSVTSMMTINNCDTLAMIRTYHVSDMCQDTSITLTQHVLATDLPILDVADMTVTSADNGESNGSIAVTLDCGSDGITYAWSDGSTMPTLDSAAAGDYTLVLTSDRGCSDSLTFTLEETPLSLVCPPDTVISCELLIIPEFTGTAEMSGYDTLFLEDNVLSTCPNDIVVERMWIAQKDTITDTCVQMITVEVDSLANFDLADTLTFDGICLDDLPTLLEESISLPCNVTTDSIDMVIASMSCEQIVYNASWDFSIDCADSLIQGAQIIIINDPVLYSIEETTITYDTMANTADVVLAVDCVADSVSTSWSTGSDSTLVGAAPGTYQLFISTPMGCTDTLDIVIDEIMIDTTPMKEYSLTCPVDTTVSCATDISPSSLGMPTMMGYDTVVFVDMMQDSCPADLVITRQWIASDSLQSDTCAQTITVMRDGLAQLAVDDTLTFSGLCMDEVATTLSGLGRGELACGVTLDTLVTVADTSAMNTYTATYIYIDGCADDTATLTQVVVFNNIATFGIDNIMITADSGDMSGAITYDVTCAPSDSLIYAWSDGSMDMTRTGVSGGDYTLTISDTSGVLDSFAFSVETVIDSMDLLELTCPDDITVACDGSTAPSETGMATQMGYDTLFYSDMMRDSCPDDLIITRTWTAQRDTITESCTQTITVRRGGLADTQLPSTVSINDMCVEDVMNDDGSSLELSCGVIVDSIVSELVSVSCSQAIIDRYISLTDTCAMTSRVDTQQLVLADIPVAKVENEMIRPDYLDSMGTISLDLVSCDGGDIDYIWSTGDTTLSIGPLVAGDYSLAVSKDSMCVDTITFTVERIDTNAISVMIVDRAGMAFSPDSIKVRRSNGRKISSAEITQVGPGEYSITSQTQTFVRGDQICMEYNDDAAARLSVLDIVRSRRHILGLQLACDDDVIAGDVNFNNEISARDLADIQRVILTLDSTFSHGKSWIFNTPGHTPTANLRQEGCVEILDAELNAREVRVTAMKLGDMICEDDQ